LRANKRRKIVQPDKVGKSCRGRNGSSPAAQKKNERQQQYSAETIGHGEMVGEKDQGIQPESINLRGARDRMTDCRDKPTSDRCMENFPI